MSILNKLKRLFLDTRKGKTGSKDDVSFISLVISEIQIIGKNENRETTEEEAIRVIKKIKNGIDEVLKFKAKNNDSTGTVRLAVELDILNQFIPQQMSEDELTNQIELIIMSEDNPNIGLVMKQLKAQFAGLYDGKIASQIIRNKT